MTEPTLLLFCITDLGQCGNAHWGHHCHLPAEHTNPEHTCEHDERWPADLNLEAAIAACVAYYSDPEPAHPLAPDARPAYILPRRIAEAACLPLDSRWRRVAATHTPGAHQ